MGLKSTTLGFKGDPKLEACLINDAAHIKLNASGPHVSKIQHALIRLDDLKIDANELSKGIYGPSTAAAVLKYKRKRKIINFSYQSHEDDIVGKLTIASLDDELARRFIFNQIDPKDMQVAKDLPPPQIRPSMPMSREFSIRCRGGFSFGPGFAAVVTLDFDIFDEKNKQSAEYRYSAVAGGISTPISITQPGPYTGFTTSVDIAANAFEGPANLNSTGGANSSFVNLVLLAPPMTIRVNTGFTLGIDAFSISGGILKLKGSRAGAPRDVPYTPGNPNTPYT